MKSYLKKHKWEFATIAAYVAWLYTLRSMTERIIIKEHNERV